MDFYCSFMFFSNYHFTFRPRIEASSNLDIEHQVAGPGGKISLKDFEKRTPQNREET